MAEYEPSRDVSHEWSGRPEPELGEALAACLEAGQAIECATRSDRT